MSNTLSVKECLKTGWQLFKARPWFYVGITLLVTVIQMVISGLQAATPEPIATLISFVFSTLLYAGILNFYLRAHEGAGKVGDLWNPKPFWSYLGVSLLLLLIVGIGFLLLIVPGLILAMMFFFAGYLVVDRGLNPIAALKESYRLTKGNRWKLFLLTLAVAGLAILGMIPLLLGLLIVVPVTGLASVHAYRTLSR
ncbi:MAG TPA: DUF975 family protein [Candidatus Paceibacterota bacterium]|nr:DUF975 family protein [Candidatus Paceibacterota bacterium]